MQLSLFLSLFRTVSHTNRVKGRMQRCFPVCHKYRLDPESKKYVQQQNAAEGATHLFLGILPFLRNCIYPTVAVHVSHNGCRRFKTKTSTANKLYICQQTDHLSLSTAIFCHCQQTSSVAVNKLFNCRLSLNPSNSNNLALQKRP